MMAGRFGVDHEGRWLEKGTSTMQAYIISLHNPDHSRNARLAGLLRASGFDVSFIEAVSGSELKATDYFALTQPYLKSSNRLLSPSELGCTLSHGKVFKALLASSQRAAIVLEDDAILDEAGCAKLAALIDAGLHCNGFVHLGGQQGLDHAFKHVRGRLIHRAPPVFEIAQDDLAFLNRTVGYVISDRVAKDLSDALDAWPFAIDDFGTFCKLGRIDRLLFSDVVEHPVAFTDSSIEAERRVNATLTGFQEVRLVARIWREIIASVSYKSRKMAQQAKYRGYSILFDTLG
jgi:glycosyl transferase family 25